jgi:hypothetical protein
MMPVWDLDLPFGFVKNRLVEGDRKADGRVKDLTIVCAVVDHPAKVVVTKVNVAEKDFR